MNCTRKIELKAAVVGTGRCGTVFMARLLTGAGLPCGHECLFDYHGLDFAMGRLAGALPVCLSECSQARFQDGQLVQEPTWIDPDQIVAESSYMAAPFLQEECFSGTKIIHVVRNPVKVINSFCNFLGYFQYRQPFPHEPAKRYETFIYSHLPQLYENMTRYERAALYYVLWNSLIERNLAGRDAMRYRIEDRPDEVFRFLGLTPPAVPLEDREINSFKRPTESFSLDQLPAGPILDAVLEIGERYGYDLEKAEKPSTPGARSEGSGGSGVALDCSYASLLQERERQLQEEVRQLAAREAKVRALEAEQARLLASHSWRLTAPLRLVGRWTRRLTESFRKPASGAGGKIFSRRATVDSTACCPQPLTGPRESAERV